MSLSNFKAKKAEAQSLLSSHMSTIFRNKTKLGEIEVEKTQNIKAIGVMDKAIQIVSANGIGKIESVVSDGLKLIFDSDYKLIIERKDGVRGESYKILLEKNGFTAPPIESVGGGLVNVISFLLRVIMIQRFKLAKLIVLDESMNNVSPEFIPKVSEMLKTLCDEHGYCILAITQQSALAASADKVFAVENGPLLRELRQEELDELKSISKN
jgi:ABC-type dipeptide/oligopeptide/nickel transport system ATPase subunit